MKKSRFLFLIFYEFYIYIFRGVGGLGGATYILNASLLAMNLAIDKLQIKPELIIVDGNRFESKKEIFKSLAFVAGLTKVGLLVPLFTANAELYFFVSL